MRKPGRPARYPFADLRVGESFRVTPTEFETAEALVAKVRSAAATWRARTGASIGFEVRAQDDEVVCTATEHKPRFF